MKKDIKPIDGFDALKFKAEMQAGVQSEMKGLSTEERIKKIREGVRSGPLSGWWKKRLNARLTVSK